MMITSLDDLRPGDIMISTQSDAPARLLVNAGQLLLRDHFRMGKFTAGHAGVIVNDYPVLSVVEAMPSGARRRLLTLQDWDPETKMYFRLPEDYLGQADHAAMVAEAMVGIPYSFLSYGYMAAYLAGFQPECLARHIDRRQGFIPYSLYEEGIEPARTIGLPVEAICSVLAEQAWTLTGKKVIHGTRPQVVTPGMFTRQLFATPGIMTSPIAV